MRSMPTTARPLSRANQEPVSTSGDRIKILNENFIREEFTSDTLQVFDDQPIGSSGDSRDRVQLGRPAVALGRPLTSRYQRERCSCESEWSRSFSCAAKSIVHRAMMSAME